MRRLRVWFRDILPEGYLPLLIVMRTRAGARHFSLSRGQVLGISAAVTVLALAVLTGGFFVGRAYSNQHLDDRLAGLQKQVTQQNTALAGLHTRSQAGIDAVAARMAVLDARLNRLDAMGKQIVGLVGLQKDGFDFSAAPGEGGPKPAFETHWKLPDLGAATQALGQRIWREQSEIEALQALLLHHKSRAEALPRGEPVAHGWISSPYGWRTDPFTGERSFHPGVDFAGERGSPVRAIASGVVTWAGPRFGYGRLVIINDGSGYSTWYGHGEKILVHVGEVVKRGEEIALLGSTGRSTGPHVHLEVHHDGKTINPAPFVRGQKRFASNN